MEFPFDGKTQTRQLFIRKHNVKQETDDKPLGKTLFLINVPPYINETELKSAFRCVGPIEAVQLLENSIDHSHDNTPSTRTTSSNRSKYFDKPNQIIGFKVAYIVFKLTKSLERALKLAKVSIQEPEDAATANTTEHNSILCTGIEKWTNEYLNSLIDEKVLDSEVTDYMHAFEAREQEEREMAKNTEVDADGWTVVKRGKAGGGGFQQKESILKALEDKIEKGKEKKEFKNFYAFQIRESKQKHIVSLRKKFAQDKLKIEAMKKVRRFKPF